MRVLVASVFVGALLAGCTAGPVADPQSACATRGYETDSHAWRACTGAGGVMVATGPGSPYHLMETMED